MTAISVDRLLALLLAGGAEIQTSCNFEANICDCRYLLGCIWCRFFMLHFRSPEPFGMAIYTVGIPTCLVISIASYIKIFRTFSDHHTQVQDRVEQQPSQPNALNMERYRQAVYTALWVQLALVVCYVPYFIVQFFVASSRPSSTLSFARTITLVFVSFNSTLNPFLYCWKISEVRQAVKQTIRPWS